MYALGIDLGTTYTAAATWRDGQAQIVSLGGRGAAIPSVVLLRADETFLTGEAANRRGLTEPQRVAREFKRRVGDPTPVMLGGAPYSAEALMSQLLRAVVSEVVTREGAPPLTVCVSHPANWGPYKIDLLRQAVRMADLPSVSFVTEPEAAAVNYAQEQRLGVGAVVAVYDLGGGTFDSAVLQRTAGGFTILGEPEGIERLGGIDFDAAVFNHVRTTLGSALDDLDEDDPAVITAVARLREECVEAKEALSADTDTTIPVLLPSVNTEVRLTRSELESMVRPALHGSIEALRRAVRSAGLTPEQLHSVLLVGGSSRMPLVGQLVTAELGRPVAVDTHPKHAVALGAARLAGGGFVLPAGSARRRSAAARFNGPPRTAAAGAAGVAGAGAAGVAGAGAAGVAGAGAAASVAGGADAGTAGAGAAGAARGAPEIGRRGGAAAGSAAGMGFAGGTAAAGLRGGPGGSATPVAGPAGHGGAGGTAEAGAANRTSGTTGPEASQQPGGPTAAAGLGNRPGRGTTPDAGPAGHGGAGRTAEAGAASRTSGTTGPEASQQRGGPTAAAGLGNRPGRGTTPDVGLAGRGGGAVREAGVGPAAEAGTAAGHGNAAGPGSGRRSAASGGSDAAGTGRGGAGGMAIPGASGPGAPIPGAGVPGDARLGSGQGRGAAQGGGRGTESIGPTTPLGVGSGLGARSGRGTSSGGPRASHAGTTQPFEVDGESGAEPSRVGPPPEAAARRRRVLVIAAGVVALVLLAGVGVGLAVLEGNDGSSASSSEPTSNTPASTLPVDEQCTDAIMSNPRWVCLTSAIVADGRFTLDYRGDGGLLNINGGYHLHVYGGDGTNPPAAVMGMHAPPAEQGTWYVEDRRPAVLDVTDERFRTAIGDAPKVCARIADANHHLVPDTNDTYVTGNCVPITRTEPSVTKATQVQPTRGNRPTTTKPTTTTESSTTTDTTTTTTTTELEVLTPGPAT